MRYIMALDEGTTSARSIIYDENLNTVAVSQKEFTQKFPKPSWVEHDAEEIFSSQLYTMKRCLEKASLNAKDIAVIGITNQRETTVVWDRNTGKPVYNAIVWQCRRTADYCEKLTGDEAFASHVKESTGLLIDPYFCATKIKWILDNVSGAREKAEAGELLFGTIDSWLVYNLTGGTAHISDYSNVSRTMLFDINRLEWDRTILERLGIPESMLPAPVPSSGICAYTDEAFLGVKIPIGGIAGDQQSSLFGQCCFEEGQAKNTYGTGCFLLMNTGQKPAADSGQLVNTIAWNIEGKTHYALEGSVFTGGAVIQWLRDELKIIDTAPESYDAAMKVPDTAGVYIVPAFTGLGAPHWNADARGIITGITRGAGRNHIIRAALEAIAYQVKDLAICLEETAGITLKELNVDGGACTNDFLMQFQSDIMGIPVTRPVNVETTALGAAMLAALAYGIFPDQESLCGIRKTEKIFTPSMDTETADKLTAGWRAAVKRCTMETEG